MDVIGQIVAVAIYMRLQIGGELVVERNCIIHLIFTRDDITP